jgi:hypothetical protein
MQSTDRKLELKAKTSVAQTDSQPYVYAKGLWNINRVENEAKDDPSGDFSNFNGTGMGHEVWTLQAVMMTTTTMMIIIIY